jgi:bacillithiol biosynthesis deacetylase BshB1
MVDILAIAAHPDDIELNIAGTLLKARDAEYSIALVDLTEGERGSRGSRELRRDETRCANQVLGIDESMRWNLGLPDGDIDVSKENALKVVQVIRHFRPRIILFPWERDRHPDHEHTHRLVREAYFDAGLRHVETEHEGRPQLPYRPAQMYTFMQAYEKTPDFIIDISAQFERKLDAIAAYSSQFTVPGRTIEERAGEPETFISHSKFMDYYIARMKHWGFLIGAEYGEGFCTVSGPLRVNDLMATV